MAGPTDIYELLGTFKEALSEILEIAHYEKDWQRVIEIADDAMDQLED